MKVVKLPLMNLKLRNKVLRYYMIRKTKMKTWVKSNKKTLRRNSVQVKRKLINAQL